MQEIRRSVRVEFDSSGYRLAGIVDAPVDNPRGFLLFSHCFTCNKDLKAIVRISRGLAAHGWGVLRYDFRGLGDSKGSFTETNFTTNCQDLESAAAFLSNQYSPPIGLIGHSFGGAASLASLQRIASSKAAVLIASPSDTSHLADLLIRMNPDIPVAGRGRVSIGGRNFEIDSQMINDFHSHNLPELARQVRKPTLIFHSPTDETLAYSHAQRIHSAASQNAESSLVTLPGSDHLLVKNESDIQLIVEMASAWLTRIAE